MRDLELAASCFLVVLLLGKWTIGRKVANLRDLDEKSLPRRRP